MGSPGSAETAHIAADSSRSMLLSDSDSLESLTTSSRWSLPTRTTWSRSLFSGPTTRPSTPYVSVTIAMIASSSNRGAALVRTASAVPLRSEITSVTLVLEKVGEQLPALMDVRVGRTGHGGTRRRRCRTVATELRLTVDTVARTTRCKAGQQAGSALSQPFTLETYGFRNG